MIDLSPVKTGIDVLEKLGLLEKLSLKLVNNPDKAARHLNIALGELEVGYIALHDAIIELSTLSFKAKEIDETRKLLIKIKDGRVADQVRPAKGSCTRIWNIYTTFLRGWFSQSLNEEESNDLHRLFCDLDGMDGRFIGAVDVLSSEAQQFAFNVLSKLSQNQLAESEELTKDFENKLAPIRERLTESMKQLWVLQDMFVRVGRVV